MDKTESGESEREDRSLEVKDDTILIAESIYGGLFEIARSIDRVAESIIDHAKITSDFSDVEYEREETNTYLDGTEK